MLIALEGVYVYALNDFFLSTCQTACRMKGLHICSACGVDRMLVLGVESRHFE